MTDSFISVGPGGTGFIGHDAVKLYQAVALKSALTMHRKCGMVPNRGWTISKMFALAGSFTGKSYKRGQHQSAIDDLNVWIETMKSALPIERDAS